MQRLRAACDDGVALACFYWGNAVGETGADAEAAKQAYGLACQGHTSLVRPLACTRFALLRLAAVTSAAEAEPLTKVLRAACERSVAEACCALAEVYAAGRWSPADAARASDTRQRACSLGAQKCCGP
jgi:TPR repeat protein